MNAVLRLNLIVTFMFFVALTVTISFMLQQAAKDINREVLSSVSFNHRLLTVAADNDRFLNDIIEGTTRHVRIDILEPDDLPASGPGSNHVKELSDDQEDEVPAWFAHLIPGIDDLEDKQYFRYMADGRVLRLQADSSDELEEVWESVQLIFVLFILSAILSNGAIYLGVRRGIKPVSDFLVALNEIEKGHLKARLKHYSINEINNLSRHFNKMAEALEHAEADNKKLTHELMSLQEKERAHLARELHDDLGQYLTGIQAQAYILERKVDDAEIVARVGQQIATNCEQMQISFRQLIRDLHPVILEQLGLKEAVKSLIDTWSYQQQVDVDYKIADSLPAFSDEINTHIYRILQESLNNISRHANATHVDINIDVLDNLFTIQINDNGKGLANIDLTGLGLRSMKERANCLSGELKVSDVPEGGCSVLLKLPVVK